VEKLIITAAITGAITEPSKTPYLPITPKQIIKSAVEAYHAGASIGHIHVRNDDGTPSLDVDKFREVAEGIQSQCDMVLCMTTGGGLSASEERMGSLELRPELASLDAGTMNFGDSVFMNPPDFLTELAKRMKNQGIKPELEVYDASMIYNAMRLADKGLIEPPFHFQFVLGVAGGAPATAKSLLHLIEQIPTGSTWSVIGIGIGQLPMNLIGMAMGGHVRTGLEDNIYYAKGKLATSNAQLVSRLVRLAREFGREVATAADTRNILGLGGA